MRCVQVDFHRRSKHGGITQTTAWIDTKWKLKMGDKVSFADFPKREWIVSRVGTIFQEYEEIHQKWGLGLPKNQRTEV